MEITNVKNQVTPESKVSNSDRDLRTSRSSNNQTSKEVYTETHKATDVMKTERVEKATVKLSHDDAKKVAKSLRQHVGGNRLSFKVIDPTRSDPNNVIVVIRNSDNKIVAEIPDKKAVEVSQMLDNSVGMGHESIEKGIIIDQLIGN